MRFYDYARPQLIKELEQYMESLKTDVIEQIDCSLEEYELANGTKPLFTKLIKEIFEIEEKEGN